MLQILVWCAFGFAGGWIAAWKGYPPLVGIIAGALLGPCGLIIGVLLPRTKQGKQVVELNRRLDDEGAELSKRRNCPECGREISAQATVCGLCGQHLTCE